MTPFVRPLAGSLLGLLACGGPSTAPAASTAPATRVVSPAPVPTSSPAPPTAAATIPTLRYRVVASHPHDPSAFTQGLLLHDGRLYESTGQFGQSTLREVELATGRVLRRQVLARDEFGEGLAILGGELFQITWRNGRAHVWGLDPFERRRELAYDGEGWGLASDGRELVQSDGSAALTFRDPSTFAALRTLAVRRGGNPQFYLNELEWIGDAIWANVWMSDEIVRIDAGTGEVTGVLDASGLLTAAEASDADVLNGIAWDEKGKRLLVTGKYWPRLFALELEESPPPRR